MTVKQGLARVREGGKRISRTQFYKYLGLLKIKPKGLLAQRPQQYPDDTAERILHVLGLDPEPPKTPHAHPWRQQKLHNRNRSPKRRVALTSV